MAAQSQKPRPGGQPALCLRCAWRADCKKKYNVAGGPTNCPDYAPDLTIKDQPEQEK